MLSPFLHLSLVYLLQNPCSVVVVFKVFVTRQAGREAPVSRLAHIVLITSFKAKYLSVCEPARVCYQEGIYTFVLSREMIYTRSERPYVWHCRHVPFKICLFPLVKDVIDL